MFCYCEFISKQALFSSKCCRGLVAFLLVAFLLVLAAIPLSPSLGQQHFQVQPGQAIDISSMPADILNCAECRHRLGLPPLSSVHSESKPQPAKPSENRSVTNAVKLETKNLKQPGEPASQPFTKPLASDLLRVDGVLISPATQRSEIEILKRQLQERDAQLKEFGKTQSNVEERIDQLVRMNEDLAEKDTGRRAELDRLQKTSIQALQRRELELSNLRADLATVPEDANEKTKRLNDQLLEIESKKSRETAKLNKELIEAKQAGIDAVENLRKDFASSKETDANRTAQAMAEKSKTVESQQTTIRKLEEQLEKANKTQRDDAERNTKLREDLNAAFAARTKALEDELAKPNNPFEPPATNPQLKPSPVESEPIQTRRAF